MAVSGRNAKVSLYVPAYNAAPFLADCLGGLLSQTRPPDEIMVVDDGSTDATSEVAARFPGVKVIPHGANRGLAVARNTGVRSASFELVAAIDADCVPHPEWLQRLLEAYFAVPGVSGVGGKLLERYQSTAPDRWRAVHLKQHRGDTPVLDPGFLWGHSTLFRKEALFNAGLYHERLRTNAEDVEMSEKLQRAGHKLYYQPLAIAEHVKRDSLLSVANTNWRYYFFGYFYDVTLSNYASNFRLNGFPRIREIVSADLKSRDPRLFLISIFVIAYCLISDLKYVILNHGTKRLYD